MRRTWSVVCGAALTACASAPKSFTAPVPMNAAEAFDCANRQVNELGYTVSAANREAGFLKAERRVGGAGETARKAGAATTAVLTVGIVRPKVAAKWDELTASVFSDAGGNRQIRVTAATTEETGGGRRSKAPSDQGAADARALLAACGGRP